MTDEAPVRAIVDGAGDPPLSDPRAAGAEVESGNNHPQPPKRRTGCGLPIGCPITPLGKDGAVRWFLDGNSQLRGIEGARLTRLQILDLLGTSAAEAEKIFGSETHRGAIRFDSGRAE